jgi:hypothetical protein
MGKVASRRLLSAATSTGAGSSANAVCVDRTFQAVGVTTAGAGAATIKIQVSNDDTNWIDLGTITLTLSTTDATDGFASQAAWQHVRANITAISGTGASVTVYMAEA